MCLLWALPLSAAPISPLLTPPSSPATGPPNRLVDLIMFRQVGSLGVSFGVAIGLDPCQTVNAWRQEWRLYPCPLPTLLPPPPPPGRAGCLHLVRVSQCVLTHPLQLMTCKPGGCGRRGTWIDQLDTAPIPQACLLKSQLVSTSPPTPFILMMLTFLIFQVSILYFNGDILEIMTKFPRNDFDGE